MYENLKSLGIQEPTSVDSYTLRQEANHDILKIYFKKQKGEFFAKSVKFKYPRQRKTMLVDSGTHEYKDVTEINANLKYVVDELDNLTQGVHVQADPDIATVTRGVEQILEFQPDAVVAFGGGSAIDAASRAAPPTTIR